MTDLVFRTGDNPPPLPDEGGTLGASSLICALLFVLSAVGLPAIRIPITLVMAVVLAPLSLLVGSVLGLMSIFSRSPRNRRMGVSSLCIIWATSAILATLLTLWR